MPKNYQSGNQFEKYSCKQNKKIKKFELCATRSEDKETAFNRSVLVFIILSFHTDIYTTCVACIGVPAYLSGYIATGCITANCDL